MLVSSHLYDTETNARKAAQVGYAGQAVSIVTAGVQAQGYVRLKGSTVELLSLCYLS